jgi:hypothetical protein
MSTTGGGAGPPPMAAPSLSGIAPLLTLSLYTGDGHGTQQGGGGDDHGARGAVEAMATVYAGWRRHVATTHDEAALHGYGAWEAMSGHRA